MTRRPWANLTITLSSSRLRKNSTHGLTFIAAYTLSKSLSNSDSAMYNPTYIQDFYNRKLEKSITYFDYPQVVKLTWIYSLPFGHNQKFLASGRLADRLAGGWQFTGHPTVWLRRSTGYRLV